MTPALRHAAWLLPWCLFTAWCVAGVPPSVDLPAHAAQLQTLAELVRGDPAVSRVYAAHAPVGYGLPTWLFLPVALVADGATAARAAVWATLVALPLALLALARALGRATPPTLAVLALPFCFNVSYWYGFLHTLFALPLVLLGVAAYARAEADARRLPVGPLLALAGLALATFASHVLALAALGVAVGGLALVSARRGRAVALAAVGLLPTFVLGAARLAHFAGRAVDPGAHRVPNAYDAAAHVNWFFKAFRQEGLLSVALPVALTLLLVGLALRRREGGGARRAWAVFLALAALYVAAPKAVSGAWLIHARFAALAGLAALLLVDVGRLPRALRGALGVLVLLSLAETARFHVRFARGVEGLAEVAAAPPPPGPHGFVSLVGPRPPGVRLVYYEHLGGWWTAAHGGVGHHLFGDADHLPVRFRPGVSLPDSLEALRREDVQRFDALLVLGAGALPADAFAGFTETARAGAWRRLERR